ncbi:MAG: hypothetical protein WDN45_18220 [Caulobacteraceae bacterium]
MASIGQTDAAARSRRETPDDMEREMTVETARRLRESPLFGVHPDGLGPTLGGNLLQPNPGHAVDWEDEDYDPPT